jgi:hypothetical protein
MTIKQKITQAASRLRQQAQPRRKGLNPTLYCSFCGKTQHAVQKLIAGPSVFICNECVGECNRIIAAPTDAPEQRVRPAVQSLEELESMSTERLFGWLKMEQDCTTPSLFCESARSPGLLSDKRSASPAKPHGTGSLDSRKRVLSFVLVTSATNAQTINRRPPS